MTAPIVSPATIISKQERRTIRWTVCWTLWYGAQKHRKAKAELNATFLMKHHINNSRKTFLLYRFQMWQLRTFPKPVFDQLAIELPMLMGFRAKEVCTLRAEHIDFQNMTVKVLDAKKKQFFTLPLNHEVARHIESILNGRSKGPVLRSRSNRNKGEELTPTSIWYICRKWTIQARLPNAEDISPKTGRAYFAKFALDIAKMSLPLVKTMMRHSNSKITLEYADQFTFVEDLQVEDLQDEYDKFQQAMEEENNKFQSFMAKDEFQLRKMETTQK